MPKGREGYAWNFINLIDDKFPPDAPNLEDYLEQSIHLSPTTTLSLCPADNLSVLAFRPPAPDETIPKTHDQEYRIEVDEHYPGKTKNQVQFYILAGRLVMQNIPIFSGDNDKLPHETDDDYTRRRAKRTAANTIRTLDNKSDGVFDRPLTLDESEELLQWLSDTEVA